MATVAERFWKYVEKTENCWNWSGTTAGAGYGGFRGEGSRRTYAHRWSYEALVGPIPDGLEIDHLCRNRKCVRPDHLEPVTHAENHKRRTGHKSGPYDVGTHCRHGHERTPENTGINRQGSRFCRPCARLDTQRSRRRNTNQ